MGRLPVLAALALGLAFAAPGPAPAAPRTHTVVIEKMAFGAMPADAKAGDSIEWINRDVVRHTATARDRSFDADLKPGARARVVLRKAGVIPVYCRFHPGMTARLTVR